MRVYILIHAADGAVEETGVFVNKEEAKKTAKELWREITGKYPDKDDDLSQLVATEDGIREELLILESQINNIAVALAAL